MSTTKTNNTRGIEAMKAYNRAKAEFTEQYQKQVITTDEFESAINGLNERYGFTVNTDKETITQNTPSHQERLNQIKNAIERNNMHRAAEYENENIVTVWSMRVKGAVQGKANRYYAVMSRASMFAPMITGSKGHALRGAFKAVHFQFDVKTGEVFFAPSETRERKNAVHAVSWLIDEFKTGLHMIHNGKHEGVRGYNQLLKPRFIQFSMRYAGKSDGTTEFVADTVNTDLKKVERD